MELGNTYVVSMGDVAVQPHQSAYAERTMKGSADFYSLIMPGFPGLGIAEIHIAKRIAFCDHKRPMRATEIGSVEAMRTIFKTRGISLGQCLKGETIALHVYNFTDEVIRFCAGFRGRQIPDPPDPHCPRCYQKVCECRKCDRCHMPYPDCDCGWAGGNYSMDPL